MIRPEPEAASLLVASLVCAAFCALAMTAAPSVGWLDSGSLVSAAWHMGVGHPPGEAGWLPLAKLAALLPVGDIAFRMNLLSALSVAACGLPLFALFRGLGGVGARAHADRLALAWLLFVGTLGVGAWTQGVRAEVYGLSAWCLLAALAAATSLRGLRASALAGFLLGLATAVHPLLAAAATPGLALARGTRSPLRPLDFGVAIVAGLWAFAQCLWLPLRALARPSFAWGLPDSPSRFLDVLLGRGFAQNFGGEHAAYLSNLGVTWEVFVRFGLPVVLPLAIFGLWQHRDRSTARALGAALPLWLLGNALTILPQNKVFPENPDLLGYLLVGHLALLPFAALGARSILEGAPPQIASPLVRKALLLLVGGGALLIVSQGATASRIGNHGARRFATEQGFALPTGAILMTSGNDTAFTWTYLNRVEGRRSDLVLLHRVLLGHAHELARLGGEAGFLRQTGWRWRPLVREDPLRLGPSRRAFFLEYRDFDGEIASASMPSAARGLLVGPRGAGFDELAPVLREIEAGTLAELSDLARGGDVYAAMNLGFYREQFAPGEEQP